jgi:predicted adenine nucleotide alpha hydrolase (AANH) superfamily ATPase
MYDQRDTIRDDLVDADYKTVLQQAGIMEERSDRCNPCYSMRLEQAAAQAAKLHIPYFTSTLLISPKKKMDKLFRR